MKSICVNQSLKNSASVGSGDFKNVDNYKLEILDLENNNLNHYVMGLTFEFNYNYLAPVVKVFYLVPVSYKQDFIETVGEIKVILESKSTDSLPGKRRELKLKMFSAPNQEQEIYSLYKEAIDNNYKAVIVGYIPKGAEIFRVKLTGKKTEFYPDLSTLEQIVKKASQEVGTNLKKEMSPSFENPPPELKKHLILGDSDVNKLIAQISFLLLDKEKITGKITYSDEKLSPYQRKKKALSSTIQDKISDLRYLNPVSFYVTLDNKFKLTTLKDEISKIEEFPYLLYQKGQELKKKYQDLPEIKVPTKVITKTPIRKPYDALKVLLCNCDKITYHVHSKISNYTLTFSNTIFEIYKQVLGKEFVNALNKIKRSVCKQSDILMNYNGNFDYELDTTYVTRQRTAVYLYNTLYSKLSLKILIEDKLLDLDLALDPFWKPLKMIFLYSNKDSILEAYPFPNIIQNSNLTLVRQNPTSNIFYVYNTYELANPFDVLSKISL